jgi:hypothetical protein
VVCPIKNLSIYLSKYLRIIRSVSRYTIFFSCMYVEQAVCLNSPDKRIWKKGLDETKRRRETIGSIGEFTSWVYQFPSVEDNVLDGWTAEVNGGRLQPVINDHLPTTRTSGGNGMVL